MARNRDREDAGKSKRSHRKHTLLSSAVGGQVSAFRAKHHGRILLIDGNAGDGEGVQQDQLDMFGENPSCATAEYLVKLAKGMQDVDVLLCEVDRNKRIELAAKFPSAKIIVNHNTAPNYVTRDHIYVLWLSDPCGPAEQGIEPMASVASMIRSDFVLTFNEGFLHRLAGTKEGGAVVAEARPRHACP